MATTVSRLAIFVVACGARGQLNGAVIYDKSVSGDLSISGLTPTVITVASGSNQVLGTTGVRRGR